MSRAERDSGEINAAAEEVRASQAGDRPHSSPPPAPSGITVRCSGRTAVGQVRDHNEDNFVVANLATGEIQPRDEMFEDDIGDRGLIFAVCDGMGGAAAGEVASQMAVDILVEAMRRGGPPKNRDGLARRLVSAVEEAGRRIFDAAQRERSRRGMGTTATVAVLVDRVMFLAEVGDSRAYLLRQGELRQLTKDQSLVNQLIEAGHLTEDEAEAFEHSNIILQALGTSESVQVDLTFVELRRGDRLLVCSDGLSGLLHADTLRTTLEELRDPAECSAKLIEYAETAGGHDNITVVVADFEGEALPAPVDGESFGYVQYPLPMADHESSAFVLGETVRVGRRARNGDDTLPEVTEDHSALPVVSDSPLPLKPRRADTSTNVRWVIGAVIALALIGLAWVLMQPPTDGSSFRASPGPVQPTLTPPVAASPAHANRAPEPDAIDVEVRTDVEHATLLVNGEPRGELREGGLLLSLRPGVYRFEAQSAGSPVAKESVDVKGAKGDAPQKVFLRLPNGASDSAGVAGTHAVAPVQGIAAARAESVPEAVTPAPAPRAAPATAARAAAATAGAGGLRASRTPKLAKRAKAPRAAARPHASTSSAAPAAVDAEPRANESAAGAGPAPAQALPAPLPTNPY